MRKKNFKIILFVVLFYLLNQATRHMAYHESLYLVRQSYFNDVLCGILFPAYCNLVLEGNYKILQSLWKIELILFGCGLFWEIVTPMYLNHSVGDGFDLVAYLTGGLIYWIILKYGARNRQNYKNN